MNSKKRYDKYDYQNTCWLYYFYQRLKKMEIYFGIWDPFLLKEEHCNTIGPEK